ncbi:hypothetical protein V5F63_18505 [Xanthobacter autotrophicus DSM 597]|uniref:hypothetical protein n=1 Tax=Xanthobacter TaxID=279 RepID=UPI001AE34D1C|nr:hypothetical protein [Xanthobacter flavus]MBP2150697.1 hypothetical protein [Xanthobacter flavus]
MTEDVPEDEAKTYDDRFLCFIDILGFSAYVMQHAENAKSVISNVKKIHQTSKDKITNIHGGELELSVFSDSIIISTAACSHAEDNMSRLCDLAWSVNSICIALLRAGFLTRGALVRGDLLHRDGTVLGPALVRAYQLETQSAIFPRIIVQKPARVLLEASGTRWVIPAGDGPYFIHTLKDFEERAKASHTIGWAKFSTSEPFRYIRACRDIIAQLLEDSRENHKHYSYNKWFAKYFDRYVTRFGPANEAGWISPIVESDELT